MLSLTINTNLKQVHSSETNEVILPTSEGLIGIMTGHLPMITKLSFGELLIKSNGGYEKMILGGGIAEVREDRVKLLVPYAEKPEDIDLDRALDEATSGKEISVPVTNPIGCNVKWEGKDKHWMPADACDLV